MDRRDTVIALAGAGILVVAVAVAASTPLAATLPYAASVETTTVGIAGGQQGHAGEGAFMDTFAFELREADVAALFVNVSVTYVSSGPAADATAHARLVAPNGTVYEADAPAATPGQSTVTIELVAPIAEVPADFTVEATGPEEARTLAAEQAGSTAGSGEWTLEVSFSAGLAPVNSASVAWDARAHVWTIDVVPTSEGAR